MSNDYEVKKTDAEWRAQLDPMQYQVTRHAATERPFTGKYWDHWEQGRYNCVGCGTPLFEADTKFDAGCGWPSYWQPINSEVVERVVDRSHGMVRVEVRCNGAPVPMRCSSLQLLIELVLGLANHDSGYVAAEAIAVHRLREDLDGLDLIETGMSSQYRLRIPRAELANRVKLTPCFFELVDLKVVTPDQAEELRGLLRVVKSA